jgi:2-iminobutanoate/2-iminopropanoate deaminase
MEKKIMHTDKLCTSGRPFSRGVRVKSGPLSFIFISGIASVNEKGDPVFVGDISGQTRQVFENMKALLASEGASLDDVVKVTVFLRNAKDYDKMNQVRAEYFKNKPPASSAVQAQLVREEFLVEIEGIAVIEN